MQASALRLKHQFQFKDLANAEALARLDAIFLQALKDQDPTLHDQIVQYREGLKQDPIEVSDLILACAPILESFLANFFDIHEALAMSQVKTVANNPISAFKKYFVLRRAKKEISRADELPSFSDLDQWLEGELAENTFTTHDQELAIALLAQKYLHTPASFEHEINQLAAWCTKALVTDEGKKRTEGWVSFNIPERIDHKALVKTITLDDNYLTAPPERLRHRDGFDLTDPRMSARQVQDEVNYCIYCHDHDGDFCSKGFPVKKNDKSLGYKKNPLDITMTGCPLEEKISEMNLLKRDGHTIAALAVVMIDNPMCPATGHRICNDCMKSCIYQKQEPVNVPQIETRVLTDVLSLPWGVEIYDLLTKWNPLRQKQWVMQPYNGLKVMIAGMGPAGFTLAHHLLLEGFAVVGFDGLKIEPLPKELLEAPIEHYDHLREALHQRIMAGFGGVAEYGITVRWDKNFLKLIYLTLARRPYFQVFGSTRFGGTIKVEDAWQYGFDHFVVAVGAGLPKALAIPNSMAKGMRQANDFLMALQLGNAAKKSSLTNLQIQLPAVVIGGGLTGVDTATELQAYYISQVEKVYERYHTLIEHYGATIMTANMAPEHKAILERYLAHGAAIREERENAAKERRVPNFIKLLHAWGGVTILYRRSMQESPAYIHNHEELQKALEEGVLYLEGVEPHAVQLDQYGHSEALVCHRRIRGQDHQWVPINEEKIIPAKSILVATGTQPNTAYEFEHRGTFRRLNLQYEHFEDEEGTLTLRQEIAHCKDNAFGPFTSYQNDAKRVSLIGDTHPVFHGNVVKAIASGLRTYPKILAHLKSRLNQKSDMNEYKRFAETMNHLFNATIIAIKRKKHDVIELEIEAPLALKHYQPGQFFRLQNFETNAKKVGESLLQMEPLALLPSAIDLAKGRMTFHISEETPAAKLCATLSQGETVSLMGPTGVRAKLATHETILIIGDKTSYPFVRSYGLAARQKHNKIIFINLLHHQDELYDQAQLEDATDSIVYAVDQAAALKVRRDDVILQSKTLKQILKDYAQISTIPLNEIDKIFIFGKTQLLREFQTQTRHFLATYFTKTPQLYGSVYGNMQCMLKGVCAQCLQWQIDPATGKRTKAVFACSWQDQPLEMIDVDHIDARTQQNALLEKISYLWLNYLFETQTILKI